MAFKTPRNWTTGEIVTAPQLNEEISNQLLSIWVGQQAGDLDFYTSGSTKQRIPIGTNGYILKVVGGVPTWSPSSMIGCRVSGVTQSIPKFSLTAVGSYTTEDYDTNDFHASNYGYFTVPGGLNGLYLIGASGFFSKIANNDRSRFLGIRVNSTYVAGNNTTQDTSDPTLGQSDTWMMVTTLAPLVAGDVVQAYVQHKSDSDINWNNGIFWMLKVS